MAAQIESELLFGGRPTAAAIGYIVPHLGTDMGAVDEAMLAELL